MGVPSGHFWGSLYDGLTAIATDGSVQPTLATAWQQTEPNTWVFTLRMDAIFHNGKSFSPASVTATLNYLRSPEAARYLLANEVKNIAGVRALSDRTIEITTTTPDAILPRRLSLIMMIEPGVWTALGADAYARSPVGTGPFRFEEWGQGNGTVSLSAHRSPLRNANDIETLRLIKIPNSIARDQALVSGEVDLISSVNPDSIASIRANGFAVQIHRRSQILSIALPNNRPSPLQSADVRQALNYAVDRPAIAQLIFGGLVKPASQGAIAGTVGFNPNLAPYPYDPAAAQSLLTLAGHPNGFKLSIAVLKAVGAGQESAYQKVAQDLSAIGINATVKPLEGAEFIRRFVSNQWGPYDAFSLLWNNEPMRDAARSMEYYSCLRPRPFFCDEAATEAIRAAGRDSDPETRERTLQDIMARLQTLAPALWLVDVPVITASRPDLTGVTFGSSGLAFERMTVRP